MVAPELSFILGKRMLHLTIGIAIAILSTTVAMLMALGKLRQKNSKKLSKIGWLIMVGYICLCLLGVGVILIDMEEKNKVDNINEWKQLPITDLTIGFVLDREDVEREIELGANSGQISLEISLDRQPMRAIPKTTVDYRLIEANKWSKRSQEVRVRVGNFFPLFPKTVGELFGHELKFVENNISPFSIIKRINLYNRYSASIPFLILDDTSRERVGGYSRPVWYPRFRFESNDGHINDIRAFVVTPALFHDRSCKDRLVEVSR
jgi:hypothetical protein